MLVNADDEAPDIMMRPDANKGRASGGDAAKLQVLGEGAGAAPALPLGFGNAIFSFDT